MTLEATIEMISLLIIACIIFMIVRQKKEKYDDIKIYSILKSNMVDNFYIESLDTEMVLSNLYINNQRYYNLQRYLSNFNSNNALELMIKNPTKKPMSFTLYSPVNEIYQRAIVNKIKIKKNHYLVINFNDISHFLQEINLLKNQINTINKDLNHKINILDSLPLIISTRDSKLNKQYYNKMYKNNIFQSNYEVQQYERFLSRLTIKHGTNQKAFCTVIINEQAEVFKLEVQKYTNIVDQKTYFLMHGYEVTSLRRNEEETKVLKKFINEVMVQNIDQGIVIIDTNGNIITHNKSFNTLICDLHYEILNEIIDKANTKNNYFTIIQNINKNNIFDNYQIEQRESFTNLNAKTLHIVNLSQFKYLKVASLSYLNKYKILIFEQITK